MTQSAAEVRKAVAANPAWYHTIDLPHGVSTDGHVDWRRQADRILPRDLSGRRALDIGTFDGFWAFELERRGARVTAIDLGHIEDSPWPPIHREHLVAAQRDRGVELGRGFRIAHECLGSSVQRVACDVCELTPQAVDGPVELAFLGAMMLHLPDPVGALENVRRVLVPGGQLILLETISLRDTLLRPRAPIARFDTRRHLFNWWLPNLRTVHEYLWAAGFSPIRRIGGIRRPPSRPEMRGWYAAFRAYAPA